MGIRIALAGNPNCGKTTMFNELTGSSQYVGNWPGVTVEKKEGKYSQDKEVLITDLPGIYSLSPYSPEEIVSRNFLIDEKPDVVINLVDASNLERNLYLTTQLLSLGLPVVVALNMFDIVTKNGDSIDIPELANRLGCPVVSCSALRNHGLDELMQTAIKAASEQKAPGHILEFESSVEAAITRVEEILRAAGVGELLRWQAIKLLDEKALEALKLDSQAQAQLDEIRTQLEQEQDDDAESIIASERYSVIARLIQGVYVRKSTGLTTTQKIDKVITNRFLGLPIFVVIMFLVYYFSVALGTNIVTDWGNDSITGDGWLYTNRAAFEEATEVYEGATSQIDAYLEAAEEAGFDVEAFNEAREAEEPSARDEQVIDTFLEEVSEAGLIAKVEEDDEVELISFEDFAEDLEVAEPDPSEFGAWVPSLVSVVGDALDNAGVEPWLKSVICDGIIGGVGAVLGFVPQLVILFFILAILESCGYLARVAFIMDRVFRKFGLSGKSFIPMLIASGCAVPAIMATKTIENENDRRMTIITTSMIPCGAKLPIIALVFGALAGANSESTWWVAPLFYFLGVFAIITSGIMLKKTRWFAGESAPFIMELPNYHVPGAKTVLMSTWERIRSYLIKAGTIIFLSSVAIWFLLSFGSVDGSFGLLDTEVDNYLQYSLMAGIGNAFAWMFAPLGFGNWESTVTAITGLVAKENVVATVGVLTSLGAEAGEADASTWIAFAAMMQSSVAAILSFCAFNLLCAPCIAAMATIHRQMGSGKWTGFAIGYMTVFAWAIALIMYQFIGLAIGEVSFNFWTVVALVVAAGLLFQLFRPMPKFEDKK